MAKNILLKLFERREIKSAEFIAGLMWQTHMENVEIQALASLAWDEPFFLHYQVHGTVSDRQADAHDFRISARKALGKDVVEFLDLAIRCNSPRKAIQGKLIDALNELSIHCGLSISGNDDGLSLVEDIELVEYFKRKGDLARIRREQPDLFLPHKKRGKINASKMAIA